MRELQVIGLDAGGKNVLLRDKGTDDRYSVPADDRLRAAARRDLSRLGQIEVEADSSLRPREIQARIRLGASVSQVAAEAGIGESRIERYAHPVLLERSNIADLGRKAHPVRPDGPAEQTLDEIVRTVFRARGIDADEAEWDAWRNKDAEWIVQLAWQAGRSDNTAHWRLYKEGLGGTLTALDDPAAELIDPDMRRPLRPLISVGPGDEAHSTSGTRPGDEAHVGVHGPRPVAADDESHAPSRPSAFGAAPDGPTNTAGRSGDPSDAAASPSDTAAGPSDTAPRAQASNETDQAAAPAVSGRAPAQSPAAGGTSAQPPAADAAGTPASADADPASAEAAPTDAEAPQDALIPDPDPHRAHPKNRKNKPAMPSWEDVLLGVRSNNG